MDRPSAHYPPPPPRSGRRVASGDLEAGFSGGSGGALAAPYYCYDNRRMGSYRALIGSPRPLRSVATAAGFFCDDLHDEEPHHFLDYCFLCKKSLAGNGDIFMYRGDTPFCSEECRQEQIEIDEAKERKTTASMKEKQQRSSNSKSQKIYVRSAADTVVAW